MLSEPVNVSKPRTLPNALDMLRGNILVLTVTQALGMFCRSMAFPYTSLYILSLGGAPEQIGLINALSPLAGLIVFPLAGYLTDRAGRVRLIALAGYLSAAITLLYVFAAGWQAIAVARLLQGFMVFQFPASSAIIADRQCSRHHRTLSGRDAARRTRCGDRHARPLWGDGRV
jgi:MFS family permease